MKQALVLDHYPQNYVSKLGEDAPALVDNLVAPPAKIKEDQGEVTKEENKEEHPKEEEEHRAEDKGNKTQAEDSRQEADNDDYSDYSDLDYIY